MIRSFLKETRSSLHATAAEMSMAELGRRLNIVEGSDEHIKPRNVGLLFFNEAPEKFFPSTQIDIVLFPEGVGGNKLEEKIFRGPLDQQLRDALTYLRNRVIEERVTKIPRQAEAERIFNYPYLDSATFQAGQRKEVAGLRPEGSILSAQGGALGNEDK